MTDFKRRAVIIFVILFLAGGMGGLYFYLNWLWRACGGMDGVEC